MGPYHLRLDWLMWFAAISPGYALPWMTPFLNRLLRNDPATLKLLRHNPFRNLRLGMCARSCISTASPPWPSCDGTEPGGTAR